jgi:hypothetical protein
VVRGLSSAIADPLDRLAPIPLPEASAQECHHGLGVMPEKHLCPLQMGPVAGIQDASSDLAVVQIGKLFTGVTSFSLAPTSTATFFSGTVDARLRLSYAY